MPFRFAASGGMLLGGNTGGSAGVHDFKNGPLGTLQIATDGGTLGSTLAFVHLLNSGYTGSDIAEHGTQLFFGRIGGAGTDGAGLVVRGGGTNAFDPAGPMLVIDQTNRRIGINGITSAEGPLHIKGESTSATSANEITIQSTTGKTAAIRAAVAGPQASILVLKDHRVSQRQGSEDLTILIVFEQSLVRLRCLSLVLNLDTPLTSHLLVFLVNTQMVLHFLLC